MSAPIQNVSQLVAILQAQLAAKTANAATLRRSSAKDSGKTPSQQPQLESLIARRVASIDVNDPQRGRKAFRVFLESVLLAQFGEQLINDAQFYQMVEQVHTTMEADPQLAAMIEQAIQVLLKTTQ